MYQNYKEKGVHMLKGWYNLISTSDIGIIFCTKTPVMAIALFLRLTFSMLALKRYFT
jgi:hypothetical protein